MLYAPGMFQESSITLRRCIENDHLSRSAEAREICRLSRAALIGRPPVARPVDLHRLSVVPSLVVLFTVFAMSSPSVASSSGSGSGGEASKPTDCAVQVAIRIRPLNARLVDRHTRRHAPISCRSCDSWSHPPMKRVCRCARLQIWHPLPPLLRPAHRRLEISTAELHRLTSGCTLYRCVCSLPPVSSRVTRRSAASSRATSPSCSTRRRIAAVADRP